MQIAEAIVLRIIKILPKCNPHKINNVVYGN